MEAVNECRCCLSKGVHKDLNTTYLWLDKNEKYSDMLQECFNIMLQPWGPKHICDECILTLRSSMLFKQQVLQIEEELMKRLTKCEEKDEKIFEMKLKIEPKENLSDDSDDYFLADAVSTPVMAVELKIEKKEIKKKLEQKRSKSKKKKKKAIAAGEGKWRTQKIRTLVTRLSGSVNACEVPAALKNKNLKEIVVTRKTIPIKHEPLDSKLNLMWTSRGNSEKIKHRENLQTILKYSNATPFKNKSLLGFICGYCDSAYPDPVDLRSHTESEHKKERLEFKSNFDMTEYNVNLDINELICTLCDERMDNLTVLKEHLVKVHKQVIYSDIKDHLQQFKLKKGEIYDCAMCSSTYETFKMLKQHMNIHYSNYHCNKCDSSFATKRSLNSHRQTHQDGSFKCDHCDKVFASKNKKHYHEKTKHLGTRNISNCPFCDVPFRSYYQRNQHLVKVHNNEAQYKCNVCNKAYILKSLLMYHIKKNHLMEKNFQCTECGFRFFSKKALKAHMVKHTGERIYVCEVCHKSYARKYTLREHMRIHNNDRRFKCEVCGMSFVQKCSLKSHLLSNHGISMAASDITSNLQ